jgi:hypothetical protein
LVSSFSSLTTDAFLAPRILGEVYIYTARYKFGDRLVVDDLCSQRQNSIAQVELVAVGSIFFRARTQKFIIVCNASLLV